MLTPQKAAGYSLQPQRRQVRARRLQPGPWPAAGALVLLSGVVLLKRLLGRRRSPRPSLLDLPNDALERVLLLLDVKGRVRLLSTCRRLHRLAATSSSLWADVSVHMPTFHTIRRFAPWLAANASRLRRLQLTTSPLDGVSVSRRQSAGDALADALQGATGLQELRLSLLGNPASQLWSWPATLRALRSLELVCLAPVTVPAGFAGLTSLRQLRLLGDFIIDPDVPLAVSLEADCLPASLERLWVQTFGWRTLPPAICQATRLTELRLGNMTQRMDLSGLSQLQQLRHLALLDFSPMQALDEVSRLPSLRRLDFYGHGALWEWLAREEPASGAQCLQAVTALVRELGVPELRLCGLFLKHVPPALLTVPGLKVLHLECSPKLVLPQLDAVAAAACELEELALDGPAAMANLGSLSRMDTLRTLRVTHAAAAQAKAVRACLEERALFQVQVVSGLEDYGNVMVQCQRRWMEMWQSHRPPWSYRVAEAVFTVLPGLLVLADALDGCPVGLIVYGFWLFLRNRVSPGRG